MPHPTIRRIVTGHSATGDAIIESDKQLVPYDPVAEEDNKPASSENLAFATIWRTDSFPAKADGPWTDLHGKKIPLSHPVGTTVRIVDFPPGPGLMHRTISLDFGIVLSGEIELELDHGVKTLVKQHDIVVQRGTIHAWVNSGTENVRMLFMLLPAEPVKVDGVPLEPAGIPAAFEGEAPYKEKL